MQDLLCYLIDDGGFLIMSNQKEEWNKVDLNNVFSHTEHFARYLYTELDWRFLFPTGGHVLQ